MPKHPLAVRSPQRHRVTLGHVIDSPKQLRAAEASRPVLVLGPQRSRKTSGVVVPTLQEWDGPAVVTSVRADVLAATYERRAEIGKVMVFEPFGRLVRQPVVGWNPLTDCDSWDGALQTATAMTEVGEAVGLQESHFWHNLASMLLATHLFAARAGRRTMRELVHWIYAQEEVELMGILARAGVEDAALAMAAFMRMEERTRSSVYATLMSVLKAFSYPAVQAACDGSFGDSATRLFDLDEFFNGESNTLFLVAPPDDQRLLAPVFTAFVQRVLREAYHREGRLQKPLLVLLDEAGNIAPVSNLDTLATTAAGTNIQLVTVFHDLSQMVSIYGEHGASSIANNHSTMLVLPGQRDPVTRSWVAAAMSDAPPDVQDHRLQPGEGLCFYEHLPAELIKLRSQPIEPAIARWAESGALPAVGRPRLELVRHSA
jgi:type IV secretory pathway TraG/TraD family ATPase VirD4